MPQKKRKINIGAFKKVLKIVKDSLAEKLESKGTGNFRYCTWFMDLTGEHKTVGDVLEHPCGTAGCLGGWGSILELGKTAAGRACAVGGSASGSSVYRDETACKFYGITHAAGRHLFYGYWHGRLGLHASDQAIIAKLENIIETGKVINRRFDKQFDDGDFVNE